jgi:hypothetical protein
MPKGVCPLCKEENELRDSHYIGAALYRISHKRGGPVVGTPELFIGIDNQVHDYLLCSDCEQLFDKNGEDYVAPLVKQGEKNFPLLEMFDNKKPFGTGPHHGDAFRSSDVGVDITKLAYYALSMFWRASVHEWKTLNGQTTCCHLAAHAEEAIRMFLRGEPGWPEGIVLEVTVCTDIFSQDHVLGAVGWENDMYHGASFLAFGIFFNIITGVKPGAPEWRFCCMTDPERVIFRHTCEKTTRQLHDDMLARAKVARNLKAKK